MRLRRLDLTRYGHFTDYSLDFGSAKVGQPDLHIIFGPNEAGKSTAFEGYLDLLFGIPLRSSYNFLHEYDNMLVGGALDIDGTTVELARIKKNRNDLLDINGDPANPATLLHALSGITREQYRAMFSLDDETIEAGGEDILASQGNLGELLFSAAAGLSDLGLVLDKARAQVDLFHKARAHKTYLSEAKKDIKRLDAEIKQLDTNANTFKILLKTKNDAKLKYDIIKTEQDHLIHKKLCLEAVLECLPLLPKLKEIKAALSELNNFLDIPDSLIDETNTLQSRNNQAQTDKKQASNRILRNQQKYNELKRSPSILKIKEHIEALLDIPKSRAQTADADLASRRVDIKILDTNIARGFKQLNYADNKLEQIAEPLLLQIENLANDWITLEQNLNTAKTEQKTAERRLARLTADDLTSKENINVDNTINEILDHIRPEALIEQLQNNHAAVLDAKDKVSASIQDLVPWTDEIDQLPKVQISQDQATRLANRWTSLQLDLKKAKQDFDHARLETKKLSARIIEAENDESLISDKEANSIQSIRDESWNNHLSNMTTDTAETFHQAMISCDVTHNARLGMTERLVRIREIQLSKKDSEISEQHFQQVIDDLKIAIATEHKIISAHLKTLHLPQEFNVLDLANWLHKLSTTHTAVTTLDKKSIALIKLQQQVACAEETLSKALAVNTELKLPELTYLARKSVSVVAQQSERKATKEKNTSDASTELQIRNEAIEELEHSLATIKQTWQKLVSDLAISFSTPAEFRAALPTLREINLWLAKREELAQRIDAMADDYSNFATEIRKLAEIAEEAEKGMAADPLVLAELIRTKLTAAESIETRYEELSQELAEDKEKEIKAEQELLEITADIQKKTKYFPSCIDIETIEDLVTAVEHSKKATRLRSDCSELENRIITRLGASSIENAIELLADKDLPGAQAQLKSFEQDISLAEQDVTQSIGDLRSASDKLQNIGGDDAVARLEEERQTVIISIADQAKQNLRLCLGVMVAEQALARYRDKHRSNMLSDTAKAFQTLTNGRYSDLQTQPDGQKEILLALRTDDKRSIAAADMSKGTRFQLYLALRLAGYQQFSSSGTTLPFIADDIMETFDNVRTSAALELLQQMAMKGQALYFTHHEHVVELAREKCGGGVVVHDLVGN